MSEPLLDIRDLDVAFRTPHGTLLAVRAVNLAIARGEAVALIGESGCGKTTLGKTLVGLHRPGRGQVRFDGTDLAQGGRRAWAEHRRAIQMVFQDPLSALDPRQRARTALEWPLRLHTRLSRAARTERIAELCEEVGLDAALAERFPHQLSGGQRQRLNIARALAPEPRLVVCDEPVSALDVSLQAQIVALLRTLQQRLGLAYLFISHDLSVVEDIANRVAVMYLGRVVEVVPAGRLRTHAAHPYTRLLLDSVPRSHPGEPSTIASPVNGERRSLESADPPGPFNVPTGCAFHPRCPQARDLCRQTAPQEQTLGEAHRVACHFPLVRALPGEQAVPVAHGANLRSVVS